jgi:hypothetical protein
VPIDQAFTHQPTCILGPGFPQFRKNTIFFSPRCPYLLNTCPVLGLFHHFFYLKINYKIPLILNLFTSRAAKYLIFTFDEIRSSVVVAVVGSVVTAVVVDNDGGDDVRGVECCCLLLYMAGAVGMKCSEVEEVVGGDPVHRGRSFHISISFLVSFLVS